MANTPIKTLRTGLWHLRHGGPRQLAKWRRRKSINAHTPKTSSRAGSDRLSQSNLLDVFPAFQTPSREPKFPKVQVGVILDEFSMQCFKYEWTITPLTQQGWRSQLDHLDFVFIESAWNGNQGEWKYLLTSPSGPKAPVGELLAECRRRGLPTVFWNKEDPPHYEDFLPLARLCDTVFTSDVRLVNEYAEQLGHSHISSLAFAAQPAIHNPARPAKNWATRDIAFAGMYFAHKYPERRRQMEMLLGAATAISSKMSHGLEIFSRFHGQDPRYQFPGYFAKHVVGSLPYVNLLTAYKYYKVFLNVNSVTDSPSMCARRIFEITASGTPAVTTPSAATRAFFPDDEVPQPQSKEEAENVLRAYVGSKELRERTTHKAQRRIWAEHTYTHRAMKIMDSVGARYTNPLNESISVIASTNRPQHLSKIIATHARQIHPNRELILVAHGFEVPRSLHQRATDAGIESIQVIEVDSSQTLGSCLNMGVAAAGGSIIAKMDDDDIYGAHYLSDLAESLRYSAAQLVGKQAHYLHLTDRNIVMCRFPEREHRYTDQVMGPTIMARREILIEHPFADRTRGEDTELQQRLIQEGATIYSADRYNFVQVRGNHQHTWTVDDNRLLANSIVHSYGYAPEHYCF